MNFCGKREWVNHVCSNKKGCKIWEGQVVSFGGGGLRGVGP